MTTTSLTEPPASPASATLTSPLLCLLQCGPGWRSRNVQGSIARLPTGGDGSSHTHSSLHPGEPPCPVTFCKHHHWQQVPRSNRVYFRAAWVSGWSLTFCRHRHRQHANSAGLSVLRSACRTSFLVVYNACLKCLHTCSLLTSREVRCKASSTYMGSAIRVIKPDHHSRSDVSQFSPGTSAQ